MKRYKPTVTGSLGTSLLWHFPCRKEKRQNVSGFSDGRRRTEVARARQGLVGVGEGGEIGEAGGFNPLCQQQQQQQ